MAPTDIPAHVTSVKGGIDQAIKKHITGKLLGEEGKDDTEALGLLEKALTDLADVKRDAYKVLDSIQARHKKLTEVDASNGELLDVAALVAERVADRIKSLIVVDPDSATKGPSFGLGKDKIQLTKREVVKMDAVYTKSIDQVKALYKPEPAAASSGGGT